MASDLTLSQLLSLPNLHYADATFDHRSKKSYYGYCTKGYKSGKVLSGIFSDINAAELAAVQMALEDLGDDIFILTDSRYVVEKLARCNVFYISRKFNLADLYVGLHCERNHKGNSK